MIYCISDIHGEYDKFIKMLELISLTDDDKLYILGDVLDRGKHPIKTLLKIMELPNAELIIGNHELMMLEIVKKGFEKTVTADIADLDYDTTEMLMNWYQNGCAPTVNEFTALDKAMQNEVIEYIKGSLAYEKLEIGGQKFLLVHAGLRDFDPDMDISEYALYELVWERPDFNKPYFDDTITVVGHTPTRLIESFAAPDKIFKKNNFIDIDCGCSIGGSLGCIRLDDMKEFYV